MEIVDKLYVDTQQDFTHKSNCPHCYGTLFEGQTIDGVKIPCRNIKYRDLAQDRKFRLMRTAIIEGLFDPKNPQKSASLDIQN